jgi:hypothetical protein
VGGRIAFIHGSLQVRTVVEASDDKKEILIMRRFAILAAVAALAMTIFAPAAVAEEDTFDLTVNHKINGVPLGFDRALPVDVYVNDAYQFTFEFGDTVETSLPGGEYSVDVKVAGTDITVLSLDPTEIPGGVDVTITAKRTGAPNLDGIGLKVKVK